MHHHCHIVCQHRIEVEVTPASVEVCFRDERFSDPLSSVVQFQAHVYNAPSNRVRWQVLNLSGGPGAGTIDEGGLYIAPFKASHPFTVTDLIVATSRDDLFRRAFAHVAVVGLGPEPAPPPTVDVVPPRAHLFYPQGARNNLIDSSNTMQLFRAVVGNASPATVQWTVDGGPVVVTGPHYLYKVTGSGGGQTVIVRARIPGSPEASSQATVSILNNVWPELT